jgi:HPt (histidine-containing phosphotransfer) domain-containing protein
MTKSKFKYISEIFDGDKERIQKLLHLIAKETSASLSKLQEFLKQKNYQPIKQEAHKMKASFGYIEASDLVDLSQKLETYIDDKVNDKIDHDQVKKLIFQLEESWNIVKSELDL